MLNDGTGTITGDSQPDVIVANLMAASLTIYANNADKSGDLTKLTDLMVDQQPRSIGLADIDSDGDVDLVTNAYLSHPLVSFQTSVATSSGP